MIQIIPILTEKATALGAAGNRYTFRVSPDANKYQIREAVEKTYEVKVTGVSTMNYSGKKRQRYSRGGVVRGKTSAFKKAVVTLAEGQTINFYSNI